MKKSNLIFSLLTIFILGIFSASAAASALNPRPAVDAYTLIDEVNALRTANGLPPYAINATLMSVAQAHTQYQANTGTVTHYSADGSRPSQRALAAGYPVAGDLSLGGFFSENIQAGTNLTPAQAVTAWQGDAPHLLTMLSPNLTEVGAGVVTVGNYVYYTLDAALPTGGTIAYTPSGGDGTPGTGALPTLDWIVPVVTSTPNENGQVVHEVKVGQSLWGIADIYGTTVQELRNINGMSAEESIFPGEMILVRILIPTVVEPTLTATATIEPSPTAPVFTETSIPAPTSDATLAVKEIPVDEGLKKKFVGDSSLLAVMAIILVALFMAGLVTWLSGRERD
ncbi:MAG: LysM peptidoglycan-binding domain-containing protein [Anaerolineales bacterium]|uniref:LysM peptidoglycan-binding domain-containing protein n=1 Tax=Candidatus Desulfolinea nitratireducens TaxID=2841698 RepID=A0A8J6NI42_9CHLR|nr:LysM peptidoglycan-binding domain-containing protein [Candidatus Desulfolinea nitratireducens]MBL6961509.1 LysM peptidoglycan-binding domain-containing protein [Anaerolineales bacterium]